MSKKLCIAAVIVFFVSTFKVSAQTGDPWIKKAYNMLYMRDPNAFEYNISNYNNGSWKNYDELVQYIIQYTKSLASAGVSVSTVNTKSGKVLALFNQGGKSIAADLITNDGGSIVAQGGGNIVAQGGGNLVNTNGSNIVAQGGGNLKDLKGAAFGSSRGVLAVGEKRIPTSGSGALVIK